MFARSTFRAAWLAIVVSFAGAPQAKTADLTMACLDLPGVMAHCRAAATAFTAATDHTVTVLSAEVAGRVSLDRYAALLSLGSDSLDVLHLPDMWLPVMSQYLSTLRIDKEANIPAIREIGMLGNRRIAAPAHLAIGALFIRDESLPGEPTVWTDLRDGLSDLDNWNEGLFFGAGGPALFPLVLDWLYSFGALSLNDGLPLVQALDALDRTVTAIGTEDVTEASPSDAANRFVAGETAVLYGRSTQVPAVFSNEPTQEVSVTARPRAADAADTSRTLANVWLFGVSRYSEDQAAAADLVDFMTSEDTQKIGAVEHDLAPTIRTLYDDPEVLETRSASIVAARLDRLAPIPAEQYGSALVVLADDVAAAVRDMLRGDSNPANTAAAVRMAHRRAERIQ